MTHAKMLYPLSQKEIHLKARLKQIQDLQKQAKIQQAKQERFKQVSLEQQAFAKLKCMEYEQFQLDNEQKKQQVSEWKRKMALKAKAAHDQKKTLLEFAKIQKREKETLIQQQRMEMKRKIQEWKSTQVVIPAVPEPFVPIPIDIQERIMERQEKMIQKQRLARKPIPILIPILPKKPGRG
jgi:hypothetical protein